MIKSCENCEHRVVCHYRQSISTIVPVWMDYKGARAGIKEALAAHCPEYKHEEEVPK